MKKCSRCKATKNYFEFYKCSGNKGGLSNYCKHCCREYSKSDENRAKQKALRRTDARKEYMKKYSQSEKAVEYQREYYRSSIEKRLKYYSSDEYKKKHRERQEVYRTSESGKDYLKNYLREYNRKRKLTDIQFKTAALLRARLYHALDGTAKNGSAVRDLGCSLEESVVYLEGKFTDGMNWSNYGKWHIDHIHPLSKVDLTDRKQLLTVCNYTNLQPLWARDNIVKGNKLN